MVASRNAEESGQPDSLTLTGYLFLRPCLRGVRSLARCVRAGQVAKRRRRAGENQGCFVEMASPGGYGGDSPVVWWRAEP
ncbi:MAG: hypothetical protein COX52_11855 [Syntrophobacterales bacterium CG23_combo_of_CG06-09_8_20_14_all_48_27]|nr:MAG: hypothetical protein COX52_11855 [Syntrophobacterales bacterium CG23_combo_of_CG06-09_8_20_14_all_48_27]